MFLEYERTFTDGLLGFRFRIGRGFDKRYDLIPDVSQCCTNHRCLRTESCGRIGEFLLGCA